MWKKLALIGVKIGLGLLAPKAGGALKDICKVAEAALPVVEKVATSNMIRNGEPINEVKWNVAKSMTEEAISNMSRFAFEKFPDENVIESGVQLAYSIFKSAKKQ